jgi:hypothetical protein
MADDLPQLIVGAHKIMRRHATKDKATTGGGGSIH